MIRIIAIVTLSLLLVQCGLSDKEIGPYYKIEIEPVFSKLITRDSDDRTYSGQILTKSGLDEFEKTYGVDVDDSGFNFGSKMLIFGITDDITTRAFQLLKQLNTRALILDYHETGTKYKLGVAEDGMKHSYVQVFALKRMEGVPHIRVKNLVRNGLSKVYGEKLQH